MLKLIQSFRRENLIWLGLSVLAILLDQWTKHIASTHLTYGEAQPVFPSLDWTLLHNHGAAFSFLSDAGAGSVICLRALQSLFQSFSSAGCCACRVIPKYWRQV